MIKKQSMRWCAWLSAKKACVLSVMRDEKGQGTTEYAILVGVLAVIAMLAIALFKGKLQELWDAITSGVNDL